MRRSSPNIASVLALLVVAAVSCTDKPPTGPKRPLAKSANITPGTCVSYSDLHYMVTGVFGPSSSDAQTALAFLADINQKVAANDIASAQAAAKHLIGFIREEASNLADQSKVPLLISSLECFVGITDNTFLVLPSSQRVATLLQECFQRFGVWLFAAARCGHRTPTAARWIVRARCRQTQSDSQTQTHHEHCMIFHLSLLA